MARKPTRPKRLRRRATDFVTCGEFNDVLARLDDYAKTLDLQFKRIAQIQAELDDVRRAWAKMPLARGR